MGASVKIVELNQGVFKGKEIAYFMKIYPSEASPSWATTMVRYTVGPTEFAWPSLCFLIAEIGLTEFMQSVSPR